VPAGPTRCAVADRVPGHRSARPAAGQFISPRPAAEAASSERPHADARRHPQPAAALLRDGLAPLCSSMRPRPLPWAVVDSTAMPCGATARGRCCNTTRAAQLRQQARPRRRATSACRRPKCAARGSLSWAVYAGRRLSRPQDASGAAAGHSAALTRMTSTGRKCQRGGRPRTVDSCAAWRRASMSSSSSACAAHAALRRATPRVQRGVSVRLDCRRG
jgi:hypothetical protein